MRKINFKVVDGGVLPKKMKPLDVGLDCTARRRVVENKYVEYYLGFCVEIPVGFVGLLFPRSSVSKTDLVMANCVGVIDPGFNDEVRARFKTEKYDRMLEVYHTGDRVAQLIIVPVADFEVNVVDSFTTEDRGGGFGTSDSQP